MKIFDVNKPLYYKIKVMKFRSAAANGLGTGALIYVIGVKLTQWQTEG